MQKKRLTPKTWIGLSLFLIVLLFSRYLLVQDQLKEYPIFDSDSPSPTGVKAFYTYLEKSNESVKRWTESPSDLSTTSENQLLIMLEPYFIPTTEELGAYKEFMNSGNTILLFKQNPKGMFELETEPVDTNEGLIVDKADHAYSAELLESFRLLEQTDDEVLLSDDLGTIALQRSFGKGNLIVANSPSWMMNSELLTDDHLALILTLVSEVDSKTILFDEYIHSSDSASTFFTIYPRWFLLLLVQGTLFTLLWLWALGKRFGPIFIPREETVRFSDEGLRALAAWYLKGRRYHDSLVIQADYVKTLLQERWRIPYTMEWENLTDHFKQKCPHLHKDEIREMLMGLTPMLSKEKVSKQDYLYWSKKIETIRKEVEMR